ncbi:hypothetical protein FORC065_2046 [Yersinia enterocolitica]|nr:hypothetical protein FORC065_2046 [Yersinia enterocolitica]
MTLSICGFVLRTIPLKDYPLPITFVERFIPIQNDGKEMAAAQG